MTAGIAHDLPGGARTSIDAERARVDDSLAGNRCVGVGLVHDSDGELARFSD